MSGVVVWFTGLPSSGKSTLAERVAGALRAEGRAALVLDGDAVRAALVPARGYDAAARADFYETLARLSALAARQGLIVLVAATANRRAFRARARELAPRFVEVYLEASAEECAARDAKGLYAASRGGALTEVPGAGVGYEPPEAPEVRVGSGEGEAAVRRVVAAINAPSTPGAPSATATHTTAADRDTPAP